MLYLLISIIGIILTLFFVVGTHEYAHFITAKALRVKVLRFSIGFGKVLWRSQRKNGTEYVISLIPLGGYVKMLDEREDTVSNEDLPFAFNRQPYYKKTLIVLAGPAMNLLCALCLYWVIFMVGFVTIKPVIGAVKPHSIAAESGIEGNQIILKVDQHATHTWTSVLFRLLAHAGSHDHLSIEMQNLTDKKIKTYELDLSNWDLSGLTPDPLASLGISPYEPNIPLVIGYIKEGSSAANSPLQLGDEIIAIDQKPIKNWQALFAIVTKHPDKTFTFTVKRAQTILHLPVTIGAKHHFFRDSEGYLGVGPRFSMPKDLLQTIQYSPFSAFIHAAQTIYDFTYFNLLLFGKVITGKLSLQSLGGPITIFESAGQALNYGFLSFISFIAFLSVAIGVINLLPVPGLDGGHLVIQTIEAVIRQPLPIKVLTILYQIGFLLIFFLIFQAVLNDLLRLFD